MEKLRQNIFWVGMVSAGIVLVIFFAVSIVPQLSRKSTLNSDILKKSNTLKGIIDSSGIYSRQDIDELIKKRDVYKAKYDEVVKFYETYDTTLEKWFDGLPETPPVGLFDSKYRDKREALERAFKERRIWFESSDEANKPNAFNWEIVQSNYDVPTLKKIQKRYWIREKVANVILNNNPNNLIMYELNEITFFDKLVAGGSATPKYDYPGVPKTKVATFQEYQLPDGLGNTITFGVSLNIYYNDIPKFISNLLSTSMKPELLINLRGCEMKITKPLEDEVTIEYNATEPKIMPNPMELLLVCEVIDFDPTKKQNFGSQE
ncbi:MAG: hypothetical protein A2W23_02975 [Planctomycetes bacterium RBG_16_43_13]|nr:MAG: hypothetical protein A2W23_02975 [Planctomycetes bacterium RBG_16_43_13]